MAKDDSDDDKSEKMDDESLNFLEQVRKGKSRNFVLSMKGNKVRSLTVKKKSVKDKDRQAAKGEGYQPVYGVVTGKGAQITFTIARADGFDEKAAGRKVEKLKKFLSEQTGKVFKPEFELVDAAPVVPFDDEDLSDPLIARFMALESTIVKACDAHPESVPSIQAAVNMIRKLLQDDESRESAAPKIAQLEQYLKDLADGKNAVPPSPPTAGAKPAEQPVGAQSAEDEKALAHKLATALTKLKPLMDEVIQAAPNRKRELHATMIQIAGEIKAREYDQAKQNVTDFVTLLKSLAAQRPSESSGDTVDRRQKFSEQRAALEPRLRQAQQADDAKATKLEAVWNYADKQAEANRFENAIVALQNLEQAVSGILSQPSSPAAETADIAADHRQELETYFRTRIRQAAAATSQSVAEVQSAIAEALPQVNSTGLENQINWALGIVMQDVEATLTAAVAAESRDNIEAAVTTLRKRVAGNDLVRHFQTAKRDLGVDPQLDKKFDQFFDDVLNKLKANTA